MTKLTRSCHSIMFHNSLCNLHIDHACLPNAKKKNNICTEVNNNLLHSIVSLRCFMFCLKDSLLSSVPLAVSIPALLVSLVVSNVSVSVSIVVVIISSIMTATTTWRLAHVR